MSLIRELSVLAVRQVLADRADSLLKFLGERFNDHGQKLEQALKRSSERAWRSLEVALAGPSWWQACTRMLTPRDEHSLREQITRFLAALPPEQLPGDAVRFRKHCLDELRQARTRGLVPGADLSARDLSVEAEGFRRYGDPRQLIEQDRQRLDRMAAILAPAGFPNLAHYVSLRPAEGEPLLVQAVRYFFRREIESDPVLASGLTLESMEGLGAAQRAGFDGLQAVLVGQGDRLAALLGGVQELLQETHQDVRDIKAGMARAVENDQATMHLVGDTRDEVRLLREQMAAQTAQLLEMAAALHHLMPRTAAPTTPEPRRPVAPAPAPVPPMELTPAPAPVATDASWDQVRQMLSRCARITSEEQTDRPELARVVGQFTQAVRRYETTRRTILHLQDAEPASALPVYPLEAGGTLAPDPQPSLRRISGRPISALFDAAPPALEATPDDSTDGETPEATGELLSPLFANPAATPEKPESDRPRGRPRLVSRLFDLPASEGEPPG